ncbi:MAG: dTDP-4-dehydrorhamnose 3,5-epimerase [Limnobacter sp.]|nr:dTDP-4-dehydrorhamnose 3,5-epimerase [Limnobacter sp.]
MKATATKLAGVYLLEPTVFGDSRGYFFESFNNHKFEQLTGFLPYFVQDNQSKSAKGVLRGLHFQVSPKAQGKLVRVVQGAVYDVAVDIRPDSPTFGQWEGVILSEENHHQLWIPPGLAHGFLTLEENTVFQYKVTDYWSKEHERCIAWDDPDLAISWPENTTPLVSEKDAQGQSLASFKDELLKTIQSQLR